ncbi:hypothetical protein BaRGS_00019449 [Batillaria attramentaria]|uniref:Uncharacterized protein n=1 Tax=Batillaria attramentaria TaxID=370345 RepID=A0ABD0KPZ6_9CAEN
MVRWTVRPVRRMKRAVMSSTVAQTDSGAEANVRSNPTCVTDKQTARLAWMRIQRFAGNTESTLLNYNHMQIA